MFSLLQHCSYSILQKTKYLESLCHCYVFTLILQLLACVSDRYAKYGTESSQFRYHSLILYKQLFINITFRKKKRVIKLKDTWTKMYVSKKPLIFFFLIYFPKLSQILHLLMIVPMLQPLPL